MGSCLIGARFYLSCPLCVYNTFYCWPLLHFSCTIRLDHLFKCSKCNNFVGCVDRSTQHSSEAWEHQTEWPRSLVNTGLKQITYCTSHCATLTITWTSFFPPRRSLYSPFGPARDWTHSLTEGKPCFQCRQTYTGFKGALTSDLTMTNFMKTQRTLSIKLPLRLVEVQTSHYNKQTI